MDQVVQVQLCLPIPVKFDRVCIACSKICHVKSMNEQSIYSLFRHGRI